MDRIVFASTTNVTANKEINQSVEKETLDLLRRALEISQRSRFQVVDREENSGYNLARMRYEILFAPEAVQDFKRLSARDRSKLREAVESHLRHEPQRTSKSRIKKLRGVSRPQYRLRVEEFRVFYDVTEDAVEVLAIVPKSGAAAWLQEIGEKR